MSRLFGFTLLFSVLLSSCTSDIDLSLEFAGDNKNGPRHLSSG